MSVTVFGNAPARVGWRLANGRSGECRIDRNGNVAVLVNRRS